MLDDVDSNDFIRSWCRSGPQKTDAFSVLCSIVISCAQNGVTAIKLHAMMKKPLEATAEHRDKNGKLPPKMVQSNLDFSQGAAGRMSLQDLLCQAESTFAMPVVSKSIPFSWGGGQQLKCTGVFPDSEVAKHFNCGRTKLTRIVSDV